MRTVNPNATGEHMEYEPEPPPEPGLAASGIFRPEHPHLQQAREICLRQLSHGPRTRAQLVRKMEEKRIPPEFQEQILVRFAELRLIDDAEYARIFTRDSFHLRGLGPAQIRSKLRERGVADTDISEALAQIPDEQWAERAFEMAQKRIRILSGLPQQKIRHRLSSYLARLGYDYSIVHSAVDDAVAESVDAAESGEIDFI